MTKLNTAVAYDKYREHQKDIDTTLPLEVDKLLESQKQIIEELSSSLYETHILVQKYPFLEWHMDEFDIDYAKESERITNIDFDNPRTVTQYECDASWNIHFLVDREWNITPVTYNVEDHSEGFHDRSHEFNGKSLSECMDENTRYILTQSYENDPMGTSVNIVAIDPSEDLITRKKIEWIEELKEVFARQWKEITKEDIDFYLESFE